MEIAEIKKISGAIHGLGIALTCDWLKECGCTYLAKPDGHVKAVIKSWYDKATEEEILKIMYKWAKMVRESGLDNKATAYKLDKIIWLLCTGNFYHDKMKSGQDAICGRIKALKLK